MRNTHSPSLRERKRQKIRNDLAQAAIRLFSERGYNAVTIDDLAYEVLISPRTALRYFDSKAEIVFSDHPETLEVLQKTIEQRRQSEDESFEQTIRAAFIAQLEYQLAGDNALGRPALLKRTKLLVREPALMAYTLQIRQDFERVIAQALANEMGVSANDPRAWIGSCTMVGAMHGSFTSAILRSRSKEIEDPVSIVNAAFDLIEGAIDRLTSK